MVKYIGSKRLLAPALTNIARQLPIASICDLFAGTTRVGQAFREAGLRVQSNDLSTYSEVLGQAYIVADDSVDRGRIREVLEHLESVRPEHGYFTETFCVDSRFFQPENGMRIDAARNEIDRLDLSPVERGIVLTSLMEAADRVDSTCGLQMAYVKKWAARSFNRLELREPRSVAGPAGSATRADALDLAPSLSDVDCVYLDPPYNQHSYFSNYHIWETLIRWDAPEHYGVACKRTDCRTTKTPFNRKREAWKAFESLIGALDVPWLIVSFSNEGFHDVNDIAELLATKGYVASTDVDFKRYVGAQIGIHNPAGEKVGKTSHVRNREHTFGVGPDDAIVRQAVGGALVSSSEKQEVLF